MRAAYILGGAGLIQFISGWVLIQRGSLPIFLLLHLVSVGTCWSVTGGRQIWSRVLVLGLPVLGAAMAALLRLPVAGRGFEIELPEFREVSRGLGQSRQHRLLSALRLQDSCDQSTHDVARVRWLSQSAESVALREKVQQLREVLGNAKSPAYHLAKSEWNKLQEDYTRRLARPNDALTQARLSREFASSGLLESSMAGFFFDQAQRIYLDLSASQGQQIESWLELVDLLVERSRYSQANQALEQARQLFPQRADLLLRQLQVLYYACQKLSPPPILDLLNTAWEYSQQEERPTSDEAAAYWREPETC